MDFKRHAVIMHDDDNTKQLSSDVILYSMWMHSSYAYGIYLHDIRCAAGTNNTTDRKTREQYTKTGLFNEYHRSSVEFYPSLTNHTLSNTTLEFDYV